MKTLIAIPTYNCEKQIGRVLQNVMRTVSDQVDEVAVFDNQSLDRTAQVACDAIQTKPDAGNIRVFRNRENYGLGGSFKLAFEYATKNEFDTLVWLHGDDQASVEESLLLLEQLKKNPKCEAVFGARFMPDSQLDGYSKIREYGNRALNKIGGVLTGQRIYDLGSGLNAYRVRSIPIDEVRSWPDSIHFDMNLLFWYLPRKTAKFVPITWKEEDQISNAPNFRTGWAILISLIRYFLYRRTETNQISLKNRGYTCLN